MLSVQAQLGLGRGERWLQLAALAAAASGSVSHWQGLREKANADTGFSLPLG